VEDETYRKDLEEPEDVLDAPDEDPVEFWVKKQRELVSSTVDYNLGTLADLVNQNIIDVSPSYQRRFRWDVQRQSRLIESFLMNVPVPPIFLNEDEYGRYSVIDGKQRLLAITDFLRGQLKLTDLVVFSDINGLTYYDLPLTLQTVVRTRPTLRTIIILRQSDSDVKYEVFQRLNTGGVRLNPQEIRNSAYPGPLNDLIIKLSTTPQFHRLLRIRNQNKSLIYKEMRDAEFVLRYFTFMENWETFSGGMKRQMDAFMDRHQYAGDGELSLLEHRFLDTINIVQACFGQFAFRRWMPEKNQWRVQVLASLFDAQMFGVQDLSADRMSGYHDIIVDRLKGLFSDRDFRRAIDQATNTPGLFRARIQVIRDLVVAATK
jgi:hypothetical protein